jgi:hypothetical protein
VTQGNATATAVGSHGITATLGGATGAATLVATLNGSADGNGFNPGDQGKLDGNPAGAPPDIVYPLAGALFPQNVAPVEIHVQKSDPSQTIARISFTAGSLLSFNYYAKCQASPNAGQFPNACIVPISGAFTPNLAGASATDDVSLRVRLAAADGSKLAESAPITVGWTTMKLSGGLYYWTTKGKGDSFSTAVARYDFNGDASAPSIYLSSDQAPAVPSGQQQCIGCHALSTDGKKLAFSLGGSTPGYFSLYDVANRTATVTKMTDKFVNMTTFSPDGSRMVNMAFGKLTLRTADANVNVIADGLFASDVNEQLSHPFWSPSGSLFAFVSWVPGSFGALNDGLHITGDMVQGGQIWIAPSDGQQMIGKPKLLVPRGITDPLGKGGYSYYYPAINDDDSLVVFNRSSCSGPSDPNALWGAGPCDGYNDFSAQLMLIPAGGGTPVALDKANGTQTWTNSWPRWSPDHGTYRGKTIYWIAFSSRRNFGLSLPGSTDGSTEPQLWFTAVAVEPGAAPTADPSFAPIWMPGQDPDLTGPRGNHTPVWTSVAVPVIL